VKVRARFLFAMGLTVAMSLAPVCGQEQKETLGDKLKKFFTFPTPSPTPTPRRSHRRSSPSPTVTPAPSETPSSSLESASPIPSYGETPLPTAAPSASIETLEPIQAETPQTQYFEPVRPISPGPRDRTLPRIISAPQTPPVPSETATPVTELTPEEIPESRPVPSLPEMFSPAPSPETPPKKNAEERPSPSPPAVIPIPNAQSPVPTLAFTSPMPVLAKTRTPTISIDGISESSAYSPDVKKIVDVGLDLTTRNLTYKYASADPAKGGMDCSGFIWYVFTASGLQNVPRDAREQYAWVRKAGNFQAVLGHGDDTFELDGLKPGDLLFWANPSGVSREPEITQIMIYLGRAKSTNQRLMIGASEKSTYKGEKKSGVAVFDFKLRPAEQKEDEEATAVFVGYGRFPDLSGN
jgi:cell wall-associated NlpC family hydrolase